MTSKVEELAAEVKDALEKVETAAQTVFDASTLLEKKQAEIQVKPVMRETRSKIAALRDELRQVDDASVRTHYDKFCRTSEENIRQLDARIKQHIFGHKGDMAKAPSHAEKREGELLGEGGADGSGFQDAEQVLQSAVNVQKDMLVSLQRTEQVMVMTEELGQETLKTLQRQTELMYQVDEGLEDLQGQLDRASRDVRWFYRQLAADKCFLSLFGILVVCMAVLMGIMIYKKRHAKATGT
uniref:Uncharacterized protein TCIL3000_8_1120 n=1 Tax=Trypanosoma congolense (strain IL3000) TaxID=1068625 RepID=F9W7L6_TRYCI|nr:unnamed protein product [Trypanosoma congolense IL3000]CCD13184.1 unnamed protein product [Trypanosoma congolense IL3000]